MGRPCKTDAERVIHAAVRMPPELPAKQRAIWKRDIAAMPCGFFAPCDTAALRLYADVTAEYELVYCGILQAGAEDRTELAKEFRAIATLRLSCMRALRMLPHTRLHKNRAANLADEATLTEADSDLEPNERWRAMLPPQNRSN